MVKVCAVGAVTPMGNSEEEIWSNLCDRKKGVLNKKVDFVSNLPAKVKRRNNRFADMAATAAIDCFNKLKEKNGIEDTNKVGCIFNTDYGPLETNLEFAKQLAKDDPDACSPILFSNTVHNACLGTIAINLGITGPSTMLLGSNHIFLSAMMLMEGKADVVLAGAVEEFNEELSKSLNAFDMIPQEYSDAAVVLAVMPEDNGVADIKVKEAITINLGVTPFEKQKIDSEALGVLLRTKIRQYNIEAIIINNPESELGKLEKQICEQYMPSACIIDKFYKYFGNCLGADMSIKVLITKMILEKNIVPKGLYSTAIELKQISNMAVLSADITGNYYITVLGK